MIALAARVIPGPRTIDDAYITFRYTRNLVTSEGFVFNPGEPVLGTTTPLFTLLLAGVGLISGGNDAPFPQLAMGVSAIADGMSAILLMMIGRKLGADWAGVGAALAWAIAPFSVTFAIGGLETSVYVFLLLATAWAYLEKRFSIAAFSGALALLTRPDALLLVAPLAFDRVVLAPRRGESLPNIKEALAFLLPLVCWGVFAWLYFGSPLPQSVLAKSAVYRLPEFSALTRLLQHYATPFLEHLTFGLSWIKIGLVLYPFLALIGARVSLRHLQSSWPVAVFPWIYLLVFSLANPLIFRWYMTTPLPFLFLFILIGLEKVLRDLISWTTARVTIPQYAASTLALIPILALPLLQFQGWTLTPNHGPLRPAPEMAFIELELLYKEAADLLNSELGATQTIAAGDVGVLGYFTAAPILDLVGLNSTQTLAYYPLDANFYGDFVYAVSPDLVMTEMPDYVVILEIYGRYGLLRAERFIAAYEMIESLPTTIYGSDGLLIFRLK